MVDLTMIKTKQFFFFISKALFISFGIFFLCTMPLNSNSKLLSENWYTLIEKGKYVGYIHSQKSQLNNSKTPFLFTYVVRRNSLATPFNSTLKIYCKNNTSFSPAKIIVNGNRKKYKAIIDDNELKLYMNNDKKEKVFKIKNKFLTFPLLLNSFIKVSDDNSIRYTFLELIDFERMPDMILTYKGKESFYNGNKMIEYKKYIQKGNNNVVLTYWLNTYNQVEKMTRNSGLHIIKSSRLKALNKLGVKNKELKLISNRWFEYRLFNKSVGFLYIKHMRSKLNSRHVFEIQYKYVKHNYDIQFFNRVVSEDDKRYTPVELISKANFDLNSNFKAYFYKSKKIFITFKNGKMKELRQKKPYYLNALFFPYIENLDTSEKTDFMTNLLSYWMDFRKSWIKYLGKKKIKIQNKYYQLHAFREIERYNNGKNETVCYYYLDDNKKIVYYNYIRGFSLHATTQKKALIYYKKAKQRLKRNNVKISIKN